MCGEFAETLHNNAEGNGIKAAWVAIRFEDDSTPHALNAFVTTDKGLIFIDVTGMEPGESRPIHMDMVATVEVGQPIKNKLLFAYDWRMIGKGPIVSVMEIYW